MWLNNHLLPEWNQVMKKQHTFLVHRHWVSDRFYISISVYGRIVPSIKNVEFMLKFEVKICFTFCVFNVECLLYYRTKSWENYFLYIIMSLDMRHQQRDLSLAMKIKSSHATDMTLYCVVAMKLWPLLVRTTKRQTFLKLSLNSISLLDRFCLIFASTRDSWQRILVAMWELI